MTSHVNAVSVDAPVPCSARTSAELELTMQMLPIIELLLV